MSSPEMPRPGGSHRATPPPGSGGAGAPPPLLLPLLSVLVVLGAIGLAAWMLMTSGDDDSAQTEPPPAATVTAATPSSSPTDDGGGDKGDDKGDKGDQNDDKGQGDKGDKGQEDKGDKGDKGGNQNGGGDTSTGPVPRIPVYVFNQTTVTGLAAATAGQLEADGWNVVGVDNWIGTVPEDTVYYYPGNRAAADRLTRDIPSISRVWPASAPMPQGALTVILADPNRK